MHSHANDVQPNEHTHSRTFTRTLPSYRQTSSSFEWANGQINYNPFSSLLTAASSGSGSNEASNFTNQTNSSQSRRLGDNANPSRRRLTNSYNATVWGMSAYFTASDKVKLTTKVLTHLLDLLNHTCTRPKVFLHSSIVNQTDNRGLFPLYRVFLNSFQYNCGAGPSRVSNTPTSVDGRPDPTPSHPRPTGS